MQGTYGSCLSNSQQYQTVSDRTRKANVQMLEANASSEAATKWLTFFRYTRLPKMPNDEEGKHIRLFPKCFKEPRV